MKIEKLSPAEQQRVLRFIKELAQAFRRIKRDAEKDQDEKNQTDKEEPDDKQQYPHHKG
jgi:Sec-independent protein translocase protein TatA